MQPQTNIEIFVRDAQLDDLLTWATARVGSLTDPLTFSDGATVYQTAQGPLTVTSDVDGAYISLWFNTPDTPWPTDVDCARDAALALPGCTVRCDPGQHYPEVPHQAPVFLEVTGAHEKLVTWDA